MLTLTHRPVARSDHPERSGIVRPPFAPGRDLLAGASAVRHPRMSAAAVVLVVCLTVGVLLALTQPSPTPDRSPAGSVRPACSGCATARAALPLNGAVGPASHLGTLDPAVRRALAVEVRTGMRDGVSGYLPTRMARTHR